MKSFIERQINTFKDNYVQIIEIIVLTCSFLSPIVFDIHKMFAYYIATHDITPDNAIKYWVLQRSNNFIGLILFFVFLWSIRKYNYDHVTINKMNIYHDYSFFWYSVSSYVLGIRRCMLINVPIHMQIRLVVNGVFEDYAIDDNEYRDDNSDISVEYRNIKNNHKNVVNIIIEDTYPIEFKQLPHNISDLPTIQISRGKGNTFCRTFNINLINSVVKELRKLPNDTCINLFSTTNPKNTYYISKEAFQMANRGNVSHLSVFQQQSNNGRRFEEKGKRIF